MRIMDKKAAVGILDYYTEARYRQVPFEILDALRWALDHRMRVFIAGPGDSEVERLRGDKVEMSKHMATLAQTIARLRGINEETSRRLALARAKLVKRGGVYEEECDCESVILKGGGHRVDCPLNEAEREVSDARD